MKSSHRSFPSPAHACAPQTPDSVKTASNWYKRRLTSAGVTIELKSDSWSLTLPLTHGLLYVKLLDIETRRQVGFREDDLNVFFVNYFRTRPNP